MSAQQIKDVFGKEAALMFDGGQLALKSLGRKDFKFMPQAKFAELSVNDPQSSLIILYSETLYRSYIAASVSILRSDSWLKNILRAEQLEEALLFCASLRGLLEATGDALDITRYLLYALSENHEIICSGLNREQSSVLIPRELEDRLIHFTHARKLSKSEKEEFPESHSAQHIQRYLDHLVELGVEGAKECYDEMCDFTHPGYSSLRSWLTEEGAYLTTHKRKDKAIISELLKSYKSLFLPLFRTIYNPGLMTLHLLNHFPVKEVHTPLLLKHSWSSAPGWERAIKNIRGSKYYVHASYAAR